MDSVLKSNASFIESGLVLSISTPEDLKNLSVKSADLKHHGPALDFLFTYYDDYGSLPLTPLILQKFPNVDGSAAGAATLEYFKESFRKTSIWRQIVETINGKSSALKAEPDKVLQEIIQELEAINSKADVDVMLYDSGSQDRLDKYLGKIKLRKAGIGIIGIPTPLSTLNGRGVGWLNGELVSLFARPTVGKSWFCVKAAAVSLQHGYRTLFVTTEMPAEQMSLRIDVVLGNMMGYNFSHRSLRRGSEEGLDIEKYREFLGKVNKNRLLVTDHVGDKALSISGIANLIRRHKPDLVIVDGVYLLEGEDKAVWEKNNNLFSGLKNLAISRNVAVIASTQATKTASDIFRPPSAHEVAFGDGLLRYSDIAFSMCKVQDDENKRIIQYQKFRDDENPTNLSVLRWDVNSGDIVEIQDEAPF